MSKLQNKKQNDYSDVIYRLDGPLRWATQENLSIIEKAEIQSGWKVLDVGSGTGYLTIPAAQKVAPHGCVECIDNLIELQNVIRTKAQKLKLENNIHLQLSDVSELPFPDNYFDAVISSYLLHEIPETSGNLFAEAYRVLKQGGNFVIADFMWIDDDARREEIENWFAAQGNDDNKETHLRYSRQDLENMLKEAGFHNVEVSVWMQFQMHGKGVK